MRPFVVIHKPSERAFLFSGGWPICMEAVSNTSFCGGFKLASYSYRTLLSIVPAACRSWSELALARRMDALLQDSFPVVLSNTTPVFRLPVFLGLERDRLRM